MAKDVGEMNETNNAFSVGLGTWGLNPDTVAQAIVTLALHAGYRLIDTASMYRNEAGVGGAIRGSGVPREEVHITTKLWNTDQGYASGINGFEASLERLGLDYIDLYLIHWPTADKKRRMESWRALEELYGQGRAKAIGVSNYSVAHLEELLGYAKVKPAVNQIEFHPYVYRDQLPIVEFCKDQGIMVQAYSPLSRGSRVRDPHLNVIGQRLGRSNAQILIRWGIQHGVIPLPRSSDERHLEQNINVFDFSLSETDMQLLDRLYDGMRTAPSPSNVR